MTYLQVFISQAPQKNLFVQSFEKFCPGYPIHIIVFFNVQRCKGDDVINLVDD